MSQWTKEVQNPAPNHCLHRCEMKLESSLWEGLKIPRSFPYLQPREAWSDYVNLPLGIAWPLFWIFAEQGPKLYEIQYTAVQ